MAYQGKFHEKQVAYIMQIYEEWKERNGDRPDTFFVSRILPQRGYFMSYQGFMNGYKNPKKNRETVDRKQLALF